MNEAICFEVETRYWFQDQQEVFTLLPFLAGCFHDSNEWRTVHYGLELFKKDVILRINESRRQGQTQCSLGWKSPDFGEQVNIREELDEDITQGLADSRILALFGVAKRYFVPEEISKELVRLGCPAFMEFTGNNEFGFYAPCGFQLKLMHCAALPYPYMLEIEKTAYDEESALKMEVELRAFTTQHRLTDREVRSEPPTLLYRVCYKK